MSGGGSAASRIKVRPGLTVDETIRAIGSSVTKSEGRVAGIKARQYATAYALHQRGSDTYIMSKGGALRDQTSGESVRAPGAKKIRRLIDRAVPYGPKRASAKETAAKKASAAKKTVAKKTATKKAMTPAQSIKASAARKAAAAKKTVGKTSTGRTVKRKTLGG